MIIYLNLNKCKEKNDINYNLGFVIMDFKKNVIIICLVVSLFCLNIVVATDLNDTTKYNNYSTSEIYSNEKCYSIEENSTYLQSTDKNSIKDLNQEISNSKDILELNKNYFYDKDYDEKYSNGITIDKPIIIEGNNQIIDCKNSCYIFNINNSEVTLKNIIFLNGYHHLEPNYEPLGYGGFIHAENSLLNIINCTFENGIARQGGAIYGLNSTIILQKSKFNNCSAKIHGGGALMLETGTVNLNKCSFINNDAYRGNGGALDIWDKGYIINCDFINNTIIQKYSISQGGAVSLNKGNISNCNFINNSILGDFGGAVMLIDGNITHSNFTSNKGKYGGAIYIEYGTIDNCNFYNNNATNRGIIYGSGIITNSKFTKNYAGAGGGIAFTTLYTNNQYSYVNNCIFSNNTANYGGAIYNDGTILTINDVSFEENIAKKGGALYLKGNNSILINSTFKFNQASDINNSGDAIYSESKNITLKNCKSYTSEDKDNNIIILSENRTIINLNIIINNSDENLNKTTDNNETPVNNETSNVENNEKIPNDIENNNNNIISYKSPKIILILKTIKVKKSAKKLVLQATLKQGKNPLKSKKIIFKFNGKKYTTRTNKKGIAKVTIKKNILKKLKVGKKIKYQVSYNKISVKKSVKVKK